MGLKQFTSFTSDSAGLEKILRLLQALAQILAAISNTPEDIKTWLLLRAQFALGRRYLRFFRFIDAFQKAWTCFLTASGLELLLGVGKFGFLGGYLLLESATILDIMDVWPTEWAKMCFIESSKLWFYSLVCSILGSVLQFYVQERSTSKPDEKGTSSTSMKTRSQSAKRSTKKPKSTVNAHWLRLLRSIVTDSCDLFIPGAVTGWLVRGPLFVGIATVISTVLSSKDIWDKYSEKI